jgi:transposase-like protein
MKHCLWVIVEPTLRQILAVYISRHRNNIIVAESFLSLLIKIYGGKHTTVYSDGGSGIQKHVYYQDY